MNLMRQYFLSNASLAKLVSFLLWSWLYFLTIENAPEKSPEWRSRLLTLLHGSVAIIVGVTQCKWRTLTPYYLSRRILPCQYLLMIWSWGYFAFDLLWCLLYWTDSVVMLCHHATALFAITRYMQKDHTGCTFACSLLLLELTNPLLQTRWFLKKSGYGKTLLYFLVEVTYLMMFLALRGVLGTYLMYWIITTDFFDLEEKTLSVIFYLVSLAFVYDIASYIRYKYKSEISDFKRDFFYATHITNGFDGLSTQTEIIDIEQIQQLQQQSQLQQQQQHQLQQQLQQHILQHSEQQQQQYSQLEQHSQLHRHSQLLQQLQQQLNPQQQPQERPTRYCNIV